MPLEYLEDPDAQLHTCVLLLYDLVPDEVGALRDSPQGGGIYGEVTVGAPPAGPKQGDGAGVLGPASALPCPSPDEQDAERGAQQHGSDDVFRG